MRTPIKSIALLMSAVLVFAVCGCSNTTDNVVNESTNNDTNVAANLFTSLKSSSIASKEVWSYLRNHGFTAQASAAIMGNIVEEMGFTGTDTIVVHDGKYNYPVERAVGMFAFTHAGDTEPYEGCDCQYCRYMAFAGDDYGSVTKQLEFEFEYGGDWARGIYDTTLADKGYYSGNGGVSESMKACASEEEFKQCADIEQAVFTWMAVYERPASNCCRFYDRKVSAQAIYSRFAG